MTVNACNLYVFRSSLQVKERKKVMERIHAKEAEKLMVENELARLKIDAMNVAANNAQLQATMTACARDLTDKDQLIERYSMEIRQRNDSIEKKMSVVDRLNRKYEKLTAGQEEENLGPLEATIKNLTKQISAKADSSDALQHQWLQDQTVLVEAVGDVEKKTSKVCACMLLPSSILCGTARVTYASSCSSTT